MTCPSCALIVASSACRALVSAISALARLERPDRRHRDTIGIDGVDLQRMLAETESRVEVLCGGTDMADRRLLRRASRPVARETVPVAKLANPLATVAQPRAVLLSPMLA